MLQRYNRRAAVSRELDVFAAQKGLHVPHLSGPRRTPTSVLSPATPGMPELIALRRWIPDIADRDVFLCQHLDRRHGTARSGRRRCRESGSTPKFLLVNR